ncbi:FAD-dependent oxidoreductase [Nibrella viscosa]|uniref:FAD-dependent oxidoreductase n=1 Tax=Nibrella viscosa TaxID=1084524 RepID=A0ABP8JRJ3_9BACT
MNQSPRPIKNVLIVGGGIGGQSVAIALKKAGINAEIAEIQQAFSVYGVGIIQMANALRALDAIGVADEAMRRGSPYGMVKLCTPTGFPFGETGVPPMGRFPSHNGISRRILHEVLYAEAVKVGVRFRMGLTVDTIDNRPDGVDVHFTDGSTGRYDVLITADGINSKVRKLVFGEYTPNYVGLSVWRYPFKRPAALDTGYMFFGKKSRVGLIPMTADSMYMFVVTAEGEKPQIPDDMLVDKLKAYLSEYPANLVQDVIDQITDPKLVNYRPLETLKMPSPWYKNRVVVLGDAAHATIPQLGSGAALALEDAVVLAELLQKDEPVEALFEQYMKRRLDRCMMVVEASETLGKWELMEFNGQPLPEGAHVGAVMGKTLMALTAPI